MTCDEFTNFLEIPNQGFDMFSESLLLFEKYLGCHSGEYASILFQNDPNPSLVQNENVFLFTPQCQVIAKIIAHNIIPKSKEFDYARECTSLLIYIYCILSSLL